MARIERFRGFALDLATWSDLGDNAVRDEDVELSFDVTRRIDDRAALEQKRILPRINADERGFLFFHWKKPYDGKPAADQSSTTDLLRFQCSASSSAAG